jgi:hypothetical protein
VTAASKQQRKLTGALGLIPDSMMLTQFFRGAKLYLSSIIFRRQKRAAAAVAAIAKRERENEFAAELLQRVWRCDFSSE